MTYRRLGRTNLMVSAIGYGTCQLRLVPERTAIETLQRGFALGVNLVHTAVDYEGADDLIARALRETPREIATGVIVASQAYGPPELFERFFEETCARFGQERLALFGIACIEDREALGENVWGRGGIIEFLLRKKEEGRLGGMFCTTHGVAAYMKRLVQRGVFDALMVAYNVLGYHLLSYAPSPGRERENLQQVREEVFPLCQAQDVGLMIMKPLAGGLLCEGQTFPARAKLSLAAPRISATEALRAILAHPAVSCVVPGTASPQEAEENAFAGHAGINTSDGRTERVNAVVEELQRTVCSHCGQCDVLCSQALPISWLFRAAHLSVYPSETFETPDEYEYFRLHPSSQARCSLCAHITCLCPQGIDIPAALRELHTEMVGLQEQGLVSAASLPSTGPPAREYAARVVTRELPKLLAPGTNITCRLYIENQGRQSWHANDAGGYSRTLLVVQINGETQQQVRLRTNVHPGQRAHFCFELRAPRRRGLHAVRLTLAEDRRGTCTPVIPLAELNLHVESGG